MAEQDSLKSVGLQTTLCFWNSGHEFRHLLFQDLYLYI